MSRHRPWEDPHSPIHRRDRRSGSSRRRGSGRTELRRTLGCERLETRRLLVAEGDVFEISRDVDTSGLLGDVSASIRWGDGTTTPASSVTGGNTTGNLRIRFDYSLDSRGFFSGANQSRRNLLRTAAESVVNRLGDTLAAITPGSPNEFIQYVPQVFHPSNESGLVPVQRNLRIAENEIVIYVGSRNLPDAGGIRGLGGPGLLDFDDVRVTCPANQPAECDRKLAEARELIRTVEARGQAGAKGDNQTDVAPTVGSVSFDTNTNWSFAANPDAIGEHEVDFMSVAMHEIAHVLGFGVVLQGQARSSWENLMAGNGFTGPNARAAYNGSGNVPVQGDHWAASVLDQHNQRTLMAASVPTGERQLMTALDFAALDDIGWDLLTGGASVTAQHRYPDDGTYPVNVVLSGSRAGRIVHPAGEARVTNVVPTLSPAPNQNVVVGQQFSLTDIGRITDPGFRNTQSDPNTVETFTYTIDWGDGSEIDRGTATIDQHGSADGGLTTASFNGSHAYDSQGTKTVTLTVTDDDGGRATSTFFVFVGAPPELTLELSRRSIAEDDGTAAASLTIRRSGPATGSPQTINLTSSDSSEATVPATVVIPGDQTSAVVNVAAVDDALLDGDITVELSAAAAGVDSDTINLIVEDRETLAISFTADEVLENDPDSVRLFVSRSNTDNESELVVNIAGGDRSQLEIPGTVTIPAGERIHSIPVIPSDDDRPEAPQVLSYTVTAAGYLPGTESIQLIDDEPPLFQNPDGQYDVDGNGNVTTGDALRVINQLTVRGGAAFLNPDVEQPNGIFYDANGDYRLSALDALVIINEVGRRLNSQTGDSEQVRPVAVMWEDDSDDDSGLQMADAMQFVIVT